jgi:hypothetical protein
LTCDRLERIKNEVTGPNLLGHIHSPYILNKAWFCNYKN